MLQFYLEQAIIGVRENRRFFAGRWSKSPILVALKLTPAFDLMKQFRPKRTDKPSFGSNIRM
jgi:hypothetical protein